MFKLLKLLLVLILIVPLHACVVRTHNVVTLIVETPTGVTSSRCTQLIEAPAVIDCKILR